MRALFLTLCFLIAFLNFANAGELYKCIDRDGNSIVTDSPQDGMKNCVLKDSDIKESQVEPANNKEKTVVEKDSAIVEKDKAIAKAKDIAKARENHIKNCVSCCQNKSHTCYNYTSDGRLCLAEAQNCVATCDSEGSSPSSWSDCWSNSDSN
jgi:predicted house-cleaning NTP pyrophosphatase (Maf/HAM1 superfamily)